MNPVKLPEGTEFPAWGEQIPPRDTLPTMYDLPSEDPEESGLPDDFHYYQPQLLRETFCPADYPQERCYLGTDINLYYDVNHTQWHKRPDWFAVLGVDPLYQQQQLRLSYVIWQEQIVPYIVVELLSPGTEKEDTGHRLHEINQPPTKWMVYEQILKVPYYVLYSRYSNEFQVFGRVSGTYQKLLLSDQRLWLPDVGIGLGVWSGDYEGINGNWLRWYSQDGQWIPCHREAIVVATERANQALQLASAAQCRAEKLAAKLRALGIDPDALGD